MQFGYDESIIHVRFLVTMWSVVLWVFSSSVIQRDSQPASQVACDSAAVGNLKKREVGVVCAFARAR